MHVSGVVLATFLATSVASGQVPANPDPGQPDFRMTVQATFDAETPGRVVTCDTESLDGGRTWTRLGADPTRRSIALGGLRAATPVAGRSGRVLCGDAILPAGRGTPTRAPYSPRPSIAGVVFSYASQTLSASKSNVRQTVLGGITRVYGRPRGRRRATRAPRRPRSRARSRSPRPRRRARG